MLTKEFGARLKHWRTKRGMSQIDLEMKSDISQPSIAALERGKKLPTLKTVESLLKGLDVSIADFYSEEIDHGK